MGTALFYCLYNHSVTEYLRLEGTIRIIESSTQIIILWYKYLPVTPSFPLAGAKLEGEYLHPITISAAFWLVPGLLGLS